MVAESELKVFISWSGTLAKEVTNVLRDWLPKMFDKIDPWASDVDIVAGTRGFEEIKKALDDSGFGIIVITPENMEKPWLNFEAGALSKRLDEDPERVVPLLVDFESPYQLKTPVGQFQAVMLDEDGMRRLCLSIASSMKLPHTPIRARFDWAWPNLAQQIEAARRRAGDQPEPPQVTEMDLLRQLLARVDNLQTLDLQSAPLRNLNRRIIDRKLELHRIVRDLAVTHGIDNAELRTRPDGSASLHVDFEDTSAKDLISLDRGLRNVGVDLVIREPK